MIVYAESSAVLSWLLGEPPGPAVRRTLEAAEFVVASDLILVECDRAFHREPEIVAKLAARYAAGMRSAGMATQKVSSPSKDRLSG